MQADVDFRRITTQRLAIRRSRPEDAAAISAYRSDPAVHRYQGWERTDVESITGEIQEMAPPPYVLAAKGKEEAVDSEEKLLHGLYQAGKDGLNIQRYKGLGEMNPEQLWQTTMNPESRTLLKVKVEDAVEADETFSILMGDEVEQRRRFIEDNALYVQHLDI